MLSPSWIERHQPLWQRLEVISRQESLGREDLAEFGFLYRQTASDLAALRADPAGARYEAALNRLLGEAHNRIYTARRHSPRAVGEFFLRGYPKLFRAQWRCVAISAAITLVGICLGWTAAAHDPSFAGRILSPAMMASIARHQMWTQSVVAIRPLASSGIMTNNLTVAIGAFAMGIGAGIGTLWVLFFNGLMIGTVGAACAAAGMSLSLWSFVAPHGVLEIPAIVIAGAAGLRIAQGLLFPGAWPRGEAVRRGGAEGVRLALGAVPMLIVAGTVEGFVSPSSLPIAFKFTLAAVLFAALVSYLASAREPGAAPSISAE